MDNVYLGKKEYKITEEIVLKIEKHVKNTMKWWREFKLSVTPSAHLFEDHIIYQMKNIISDIAHKTEGHIERSH